MMTSKIDLVFLERNVNAENCGDVSHGHLMPFIIETSAVSCRMTMLFLAELHRCISESSNSVYELYKSPLILQKPTH